MHRSLFESSDSDGVIDLGSSPIGADTTSIFDEVRPDHDFHLDY